MKMRIDEEQKRDMVAALEKAREILRIVAAERRRYGAISTHALTVCHQINHVLGAAEEE
jgi:hypothetical protein